MKMKKPNQGLEAFSPCPEYSGGAVCVDVTPPVEVETQWGVKEKFRLVFETPLQREDGETYYCVWSAPFTPSLHERSGVRSFLKTWLGRDLTAQEIDQFAETETGFEEFCIGRPANIIVQHVEGRNDQVYANIVACTPWKGDDANKPVPSGKYVRKKDRDAKKAAAGEGEGAAYRGADQVEDAARDDWMRTKVHVGKHAGVEIGDLDTDAIEALRDKWLPIYAEMEKPKAADKRLAEAIRAAVAELEDDGLF